MVHPYIEVVSIFLKSFENLITVCDLGCGDFNIGKELVPYTKKYVAVDIVQELIHFNLRKFVHPNLEFHCLDIANEKLPQGDCAILRLVIQHLSNTEIEEVVKKLYSYKYVILTEHLPNGDFTPNKDIISGQGIRLKKQSGVDLLEAPFSLKVKEVRKLLRSKPLSHRGVITTTLFKMF
ncbi:MAG: class I SAM-dependent methyltransferase [Bacteroidota bacterium]